jgi:hypothetical protein
MLARVLSGGKESNTNGFSSLVVVMAGYKCTVRTHASQTQSGAWNYQLDRLDWRKGGQRSVYTSLLSATYLTSTEQPNVIAMCTCESNQAFQPSKQSNIPTASTYNLNNLLATQTILITHMSSFRQYSPMQLRQTSTPAPHATSQEARD